MRCDLYVGREVVSCPESLQQRKSQLEVPTAGNEHPHVGPLHPATYTRDRVFDGQRFCEHASVGADAQEAEDAGRRETDLALTAEEGLPPLPVEA
jgi:hypothetical protein